MWKRREERGKRLRVCASKVPLRLKTLIQRWQPGCKTSAPAGAQCYSSRRGELLQRGERARFIAELSRSAPNLDDRLPPRVRATITTTTEASGAFARRTGRRNVQRLIPVPPRQSLRRSRKSTRHQGPSESLRSVQRQTCIRSPRLLYLAPETACLCGAREVRSPNLFVEQLECMQPRSGNDAVDHP